MKVLVTGHNGYIGSVMVPMLKRAGHAVIGLDSFYFEDCTFENDDNIEALRVDLRDVQPAHLTGFDAVIDLAALSNDPLGNLNPNLTYEINHVASVRLAQAAKKAGVSRFIFSSSCSLYGVAGEGMLDENASFNPITAYGESKVKVEADISPMADASFSPVYMRNATAYGVSPRLRVDLVVNNLVGYALTTGEVKIMSDGTPWRPLVHVEDICRAFIAVLHAPKEKIHNQAFNVGCSKENYRVREIADMVQRAIPGARISYAEGGGPDPRSYRVNCDKIARTLPEFQPQWTVEKGVHQVLDAFRQHGLTSDEFLGHKYLRLKQIARLKTEGRLNDDLRWTTNAARTEAVAASGSK